MKVASRGGAIARGARQKLEKQTARKIITGQNTKEIKK